MGLDMSLYKKTYVKNWDHMKPEHRHKVTVLKGGKVVEDIDPEKVAYIVEDVGTWRKANAIHQWFVMNVQDGEDDCGTYYVSAEQLKELFRVVSTVLDASKLVKAKIENGAVGTATGWEPIIEDGEAIEDSSVAQELLPTSSGFFFGSTNYDQYYYYDLEHTKEILTECLKYPDADFEYHSSW